MEFISLDIDVKGIPIYNKISCLFQVKFIHTNNNPVLLTFWLFSFIFCFVLFCFVYILSTEGQGDQPTTYTALLNDLERSNPKLLGG